MDRYERLCTFPDNPAREGLFFAVAKEIGLDFTAEGLKEAAGVCELTLDEMNLVAGGGHKFASGSRCPKSEDARHHWECTGHEEEVWFGWLKKGGLFSRGFDNFKCVYCGKEKSEKT